MKVRELFGGSADARRDRHRTRPRPDALEGRELKTVGLVGSTVVIQGAPPPSAVMAGESIVTASYSGPSQQVVAVTWNGVETDFARSAVTAIDFEGNATDSYDLFYNTTGLDSTARGGNNTNTFVAVGGNSTFSGGDGFNFFVSYNGGNDNFTGGNGINIFLAGNGDNTLTAGTGANTFYYGTGHNAITAGVGSTNSFLQHT